MGSFIKEFLKDPSEEHFKNLIFFPCSMDVEVFSKTADANKYNTGE